MPLAGRVSQQLIRSASIYVLEHKLVAAGKDSSVLWRSPEIGMLPARALVTGPARSPAASPLPSSRQDSVIDFAAAVIDGAFPASVKHRIVEHTRECVGLLDHQGLSPLTIVEGTVGTRARAIGSACLPLLANFARDREVLFKESV